MTRPLYALPPRSSSLGLALSVLLTAGCALTGKNDPMAVRYFAPATSTVVTSGSAQAQGVQLRLGRIEGSDHLRERIAYRVSEHELGYHEALRWTERPERFFERALSHALFVENRFAHVLAGALPTLDAELLSFEDLRERDAVRVEARFVLHDGRNVLLERSVRVERARGDDASAAAVARALSEALRECVVQIADAVVAALQARSPHILGSPD